jgi:hypothetical protein
MYSPFVIYTIYTLLLLHHHLYRVLEFVRSNTTCTPLLVSGGCVRHNDYNQSWAIHSTHANCTGAIITRKTETLVHAAAVATATATATASVTATTDGLEAYESTTPRCPSKESRRIARDDVPGFQVDRITCQRATRQRRCMVEHILCACRAGGTRGPAH